MTTFDKHILMTKVPNIWKAPHWCCACVQGHLINQIPMTIGNTKTAAILSRSDNAVVAVYKIVFDATDVFRPTLVCVEES